MSGADVSEDWTLAIARYLLNASQHSGRSLDLSYAVLRRVADGTLTPAVIRDTLTGTYERRREQYAADVARISSEFFGALVQVVIGAAEAPPAADAGDGGAWFARLAEYSRTVQREAVGRYQRALDALASGARTLPEVQAQLSAEYTRIGVDRLRAAGAVYFDTLSRLADLQAQLEEESVRVLLARGSGPSSPPIVVTGPVGGRSTVLVTIENTRDSAATLECTLLDIRRADGGEPSFTAHADVHTNRARVERGEEAEVRLAIDLDPGRFAAGHRYVSALRLVSDGETPLDVPIAICPTEASTVTAER